MIRLWAEIYDPTYTTQVEASDILLIRASVERVLDGPGRIEIETAPIHVDYTSRALGVLTSKRVVEVWYQESDSVAKRMVGAFVLEKVRYQAQAGGIKLMAYGSDIMSLLGNYTTSLGLKYDNADISTIVADILPAGWSYGISGLVSSITARFDGTSVLKALQEVMENIGGHMRLDLDTTKKVNFGTFGADSGYRVVKLEGDHPLPARGSDVIPLETIDINTDSSDVVNKIIPLSAGDGDSRGTLEKSTRGPTPYTIETETGPDSRTIYYLSDSDSVAAYGEITRVLNFKKIAPIGTSSTSRQRTANYLYDAASEWLDRHVDPLTDVQVRCRQQRVNFRPGDKVRVEYTERVNVAGTPVTLKSIDELFWVMSSRETYGADGEGATLKLQSIDRKVGDMADQIIEAVDSVDVFATGYKATYNVWMAGPYPLAFGGANSQTLYLNIADDVLQVENVTMIVDTDENLQTVTPVDAGFVYVKKGAFTGTTGEYVEFDVSVNGTQVGDDLGSSSSALSNHEIDITDEIVDAGNDGRGEHDIVFTGVTGAGPLTVQFLIRALIVPGKV